MTLETFTRAMERLEEGMPNLLVEISPADATESPITNLM
jgi:hypothetical protein